MDNVSSRVKPLLLSDLLTPESCVLCAGLFSCRCLWRRLTPTGTTSLNWTRRGHIWSISARSRTWCWSRTCCLACRAAGRSWYSGRLSEVACWMMPESGQNRYSCILFFVFFFFLMFGKGHCFNAVWTFYVLLALGIQYEACFMFYMQLIITFSFVWAIPFWSWNFNHLDTYRDSAIKKILIIPFHYVCFFVISSMRLGINWWSGWMNLRRLWTQKWKLLMSRIKSRHSYCSTRWPSIVLPQFTGKMIKETTSRELSKVALVLCGHIFLAFCVRKKI